MIDIPEPLKSILDLARWAPSGDNLQPWRFEVVSATHLIIHGFYERSQVYDLDGHAHELAWGALAETIAIAASGFQLTTDVTLHETDSLESRTIEIRFAPAPTTAASPLIPFITQRAVQRRAMSPRALSPSEKSVLVAAVGDGLDVIWLEGISAKWRAAHLMYRNAKLRLTMREAYEVHRTIIDWGKRYSDDKVPDQAIGLDPLTLKLMHWVMQSWGRVCFFNRWLAGTLAPRLQLDLVPGLACAAHFGLATRHEPATAADYFAVGRALQRFWLTATQLGLQLQPEMTPIIFSRYVREGRRFTLQDEVWSSARSIPSELSTMLGDQHSKVLFLGRIGFGASARARSLRQPLSKLVSEHR